MMNNPVITTQKTSTGYFLSSMIGDIAFAAVGIFCYQKADALREVWRFDQADTMSLYATVCFMMALLSFVYHLMVANTFVDVYNNKMTGKGLQNITIKTFDLDFNQITDVSESKGILNLQSGSGIFLVVNTVSGSYKIMTKPDCARNIIEFYRNHKM